MSSTPAPSFNIGDKVSFKPGRSTTPITAEVTGKDGLFLTTKDSAEKVRKVRPGACQAA
ncbi:hypothetical protein [Aureimonas sp. AU40]|uniref:hypothetical protein n=1 Tax=Aureimonas sp. AU40 TaxID=1637747 RepID=UPI0012E3ACFF|nr:hypothetical protein [Aureimonas sp. AU40]